MTYYVLMDNYSGFIWGEAEANDPIEACRKVDDHVGGVDCEYEECRLSGSNASGYHVFEAPAGWREVDDGQSQEEIDRVIATCRKVTEVARTIR